MNKLKFTKLIATCGPSAGSREVISSMIDEGVDAFRINFSHGDIKEWSNIIGIIKQLREEKNKDIAIIGDLQGPRIRVSHHIKKLFLNKEETYFLNNQNKSPSDRSILLDNPHFIDNISVGDRVVFSDGKIEGTIIGITSDHAEMKVISGGILEPGKGVNIVGGNINLPSITDKDSKDIGFAIKHGLDFIALSFVKSAQDVRHLKNTIHSNSSEIEVISKIETALAIDNLDEIIDESFGILLARGDLGIAFPVSDIPILQRKIIKKCIKKGKPSIVATQLMESMINNPIPTRAEVTDVSNAIIEGTDALLLTGETAVGKYPIKTISFTKEVALKSENYIREHAVHYLTDDDGTIPFSIANSAKRISDNPEIKKIVAFTESGTTAIYVARNRPNVPIIALTDSNIVARKLSIVRGVYTEVINYFTSFDGAINTVGTILKKLNYATSGDIICITAGLPFGEKGNTNLLKIHKIL